GTREERIPEAGTGPGRYGYVDQIRRIGETMFVAGYNRQVYRRDATGWVRADAGARCDPKRPGVGFLAIDGFDVAELYAAGRRGDLQRFDGARWHAIASPTTSFLRGIRAGQEAAFAAGGEGVVLSGRGDGWAVLPLASGLSVDSFYDVAVFRGQVFLSAYEGLFTVKGGLVVPVDDPLPPDTRCFRLSASGDELWVVGHDRVFHSDGVGWREEVCPDNV
ncbi:MAG: hypothetical protein ICV73_20035, partial [Acetobacteraceae bacterium]|nr:hypothetical protein [Acetobacteraceae bacterium]